MTSTSLFRAPSFVTGLSGLFPAPFFPESAVLRNFQPVYVANLYPLLVSLVYSHLWPPYKKFAGEIMRGTGQGVGIPTVVFNLFVF